MAVSSSIIITGGTFEKNYSPTEEVFNFHKQASHVAQILAEAGIHQGQVSVNPFMFKDSLELTDDDRLHIAGVCMETKEEAIVIVHGTSTMVKTAEVLATFSAQIGKTVILTGAMFPYELKATDAATNLIAAVHLAQVLPTGVYVCMSGSIFPFNNVYKDESEGVFYPKDRAAWENWLKTFNRTEKVPKKEFIPVPKTKASML